MRKGFNIAAVTGAVAMAVSGVVGAAGHPAFGGYNYTSSTKAIDVLGSATCATHTCSVVAQGDGFVQFMASNNDGETFIGTIVHDEQTGVGATPNTFTDESYIKMELSTGGTGNTDINGGISAQQNISEASADGTQFNSNVALSTGLFNPAVGGTDPVTITITQTLGNNGGTDAGVVGDDFQTDFLYAARTNADGVRTGFIMEIDQVAGLETSTDATTVNDVQAFTYREVAGADLTTNGTMRVNNGNVVGTDMLDYAAGEDIKAVWLGQNVNIGAGELNGLGGSFSYLSYENKGNTMGGTTTGDVGVISSFDLAGSDSPDPAFWGTGANSPFNLTLRYTY